MYFLFEINSIATQLYAYIYFVMRSDEVDFE